MNVIATQAAMLAGAQPDQAWLRVEQVRRRFRGVDVLAGVSFSVGRGEILCLVGPSGCGKSTLLRLIAGVDRPDGGRILLGDELLCGPSGFVEPEDRSVGFMFQDYALFPHLSVVENIRFGLRRRPRAEAQALTDAVIDRLGIRHLADRHPHMLSGGEQQRVALARALAPQPRVILMDEPFSNLDRNLRDSLRAETLRLLRETRTTVVMVTHDPEEALSAGDRVALMQDGRILQSGPAREVYDRPASAYVARFFGPCNCLRGVCMRGHVECALGRFPAPGLADGAEAEVHVRPQALAISDRPEAVEGVVTGVTLMGEIEQISVAVAASGETLRLRSTTRTSPRIGVKVPISIASAGVFVFGCDRDRDPVAGGTAPGPADAGRK